MITAIAIVVAEPAPGAEFSGGASGTYTDSRRAGGDAETVDQRYRAQLSATGSQNLRYTASLNYRMIQSMPEAGNDTRREEVLPSIDAVWATRLFKINSSYLYRNFTGSSSGDLEGQDFNASAFVNPLHAPRFRGRYSWLKNQNNLELLGKETRQETVSGGLSYTLGQLGLQYDYSDRITQNRNTGFEQTSRRHEGTFSFTQRLSRQGSISTHYRVTHRTDAEQVATSGASLLLVSSSSGLYGIDESPEFDELESAPQLIDDNLTDSVFPEIDLSGDSYHNIGLDLGLATVIDRLHLYTDTLASTTLNWRVYVSDDNLNWMLHRASAPARFSDPFLRYEILFDSVSTRYVKVVLDPQPDIEQVLVTELRALRTRQDDQSEIETTDHLGSVALQYQPASWISASGNANVHRRDPTLLQPGRNEDGFNAHLRMQPHSSTTLRGSYYFDHTEATETDIAQTDRERYVGSIRNEWERTIITTVTATRTYESINEVRSRQTDALHAALEKKLLPELLITLDANLVQDERLDTDNQIDTQSLRAALRSRPWTRATLNLHSTWSNTDSRLSNATTFRRNFYGDLFYQITQGISSRSSASISDERFVNSISWDTQLSWKPTRKLQLSGSYRRSESESVDTYITELYSLQSTYTLNKSTRVSSSLSESQSGTDNLDKITSLRISFETRF